MGEPGAENTGSKSRQRRAMMWDSAVLLIVLALSVFFHLLLQKNAGAFWRDECSSVLLAKSKTWSDLVAGLYTDSFPILWVVLLRFWSHVGGEGELWLRSFGFFLSLAGIASVWYSAKVAKLPRPVLAVALLALNPAVFYWGDSLRAYALAMLLVILLFGFVWRLCEQGGKKNFLVATLTAVLAAQSNYQSSYLILAICLAGALVCFTERRGRRGLTVLAAGFLSALSMIPYRSVIAQYSGPAELIKVREVNAFLLWSRFSEAFDSPVLLGITIELYAICLLLPLYYWFSGKRNQNPEMFRRTVYAAAAAFIAPIGCYFFARKAGFSTQSWYYVPILGLLGMSIEMSLSGLIENPKIRKARLFVMVLIVVASLPPLWDQSRTRRTTMDLAANQVAKAASADDLILLNPFWHVVSFEFYYKGSAPWTLLPAVPDDQRGLSYVATLPLMTAKEPLAETYARIEKVLRSGGKVWIVGGLPQMKNVPAPWIPAPHPLYGWQSAEFMHVWEKRTSWFTAQHARNRRDIPVHVAQPVSRFEDVGSITIVDGWKD